MQRCGDIVVLLIVVLYSLTLIKCDITFGGEKCGQEKCKRGEYCSPYHNACESCLKICDSSTHNFDESQCIKKCQDYIHDIRYVLPDGVEIGDANLRATVERLSNMVTGTLTLVCFMLVVLAAVLFIQLYRWKKRKNITLTTIKNKFFSKKSDTSPNKNGTTVNHGANGKNDLRLEIPAESTHSDNSPVTVTTSISRRPAEDSTLDYAYDNPAMATSPSNKSNQNSF